MKKEIVLNSNYDELRTCIFTMRDIVNKISNVNNELPPSIDRLILNRQLDELMIEYLDLIKISIEI